MDWEEKVAHSFPAGSFLLDRRYSPIKVIGTGAYGTVCSAVDEATGRKVGLCPGDRCGRRVGAWLGCPAAAGSYLKTRRRAFCAARSG